ARSGPSGRNSPRRSGGSPASRTATGAAGGAGDGPPGGPPPRTASAARARHPHRRPGPEPGTPGSRPRLRPDHPGPCSPPLDPGELQAVGPVPGQRFQANPTPDALASATTAGNPLDYTGQKCISRVSSASTGERDDLGWKGDVDGEP